MNFKNLCVLCTVLLLISCLLVIAGWAASYASVMAEHFHWMMLVSMIVPLITLLLEDAGLVIFFLAFRKRLNTPASEISSSFIVAGSLIALGMILHGASSSMQTVSLYQHLPRTHFLLIAGMNVMRFLTSLSLALFIFTKATRKCFATLVVAAQLGSFAISMLYLMKNISSFTQSTQQGFGGNWMIFGWILSQTGFILSVIAVLLFMLTFLRIPSTNNTATPDNTEVLLT